jgi:HSP20 family molecular chaperone IbpA
VDHNSEFVRTFTLFTNPGSLFPTLVSEPPTSQAQDSEAAFFPDMPLEIEIDVPGFAQKDLRIRIENRLLLIEGEVLAEHSHGPTSARSSEREVIRRLRRSYQLPCEIDTKASKAVVKNGLLSLTLVKRALR